VPADEEKTLPVFSRKRTKGSFPFDGKLPFVVEYGEL
jgi:hypothetical protein